MRPWKWIRRHVFRRRQQPAQAQSPPRHLQAPALPTTVRRPQYSPTPTPDPPPTAPIPPAPPNTANTIGTGMEEAIGVSRRSSTKVVYVSATQHTFAPGPPPPIAPSNTANTIDSAVGVRRRPSTTVVDVSAPQYRRSSNPGPPPTVPLPPAPPNTAESTGDAAAVRRRSTEQHAESSAENVSVSMLESDVSLSRWAEKMTAGGRQG